MISRDSQQTGHLRNTLHIVSEQKTALTLEKSAINGDILVWQDALYEGPLINNESLTDLSALRADYFSRLGWGDYKEILNVFEQRNRALSRFKQYNEVVLWFDSGLNNQLQLIQIINWLAHQDTGHVMISIVSEQRLPDVVGFVDFAMLTESQLEKLVKNKTELTNSQSLLCAKAWKAITSSVPSGLLKFFPRDMSSMPYMKNAILRFVQQFPSKNNGLCKTEDLIVQAMKHKCQTMEDIYLHVQGKEPIPFMSRAIFFSYFQKMILNPHPIIEKHTVHQKEALEVAEGEENEAEVVVEEQYELQLSKLCGQVTNNWVDWVQLNGIDRWLGGVHLREGNIWRYNSENRQLIKTYV